MHQLLVALHEFGQQRRDGVRHLDVSGVERLEQHRLPLDERRLRQGLGETLQQLQSDGQLRRGARCFARETRELADDTKGV